MNNFEQGMQRNDANFVPLTPLSFLDRIKDVYPNYEALIYQDRKYTWKQVYDRCTQFASALSKIGVGEGDVHTQQPTICVPPTPKANPSSAPNPRDGPLSKPLSNRRNSG